MGVLFALSLFLLSYPGYRSTVADRVVGCLGGAGALGVGLFPTQAPKGVPEPDWWRGWMDDVHNVSAVVLLAPSFSFRFGFFGSPASPRDATGRPRSGGATTFASSAGSS